MKLPTPAPYPLYDETRPELYNIQMAIEILSRVTGRNVAIQQLAYLASRVDVVLCAEVTVVAKGGVIAVPPPVRPNSPTSIHRDDFQKIIDYCLKNPDRLVGDEKKMTSQRGSTLMLRRLMNVVPCPEFAEIWEMGKEEHGYLKNQRPSCRKAYNRIKKDMKKTGQVET